MPRILPLTTEAYAILWRRQNHPTDHVFTFVAQRTRKCPKTARLFIKGMALNHVKVVAAGRLLS